jgi:hypothetical protein
MVLKWAWVIVRLLPYVCFYNLGWRMDKIDFFLIIQIIIVVVVAAIRFKSAKLFFQCLFSFFYGHFFWGKEWSRQFEKSTQFIYYIIIVGLFTVINIIVFKYLIK